MQANLRPPAEGRAPQRFDALTQSSSVPFCSDGRIARAFVYENTNAIVIRPRGQAGVPARPCVSRTSDGRWRSSRKKLSLGGTCIKQRDARRRKTMVHRRAGGPLCAKRGRAGECGQVALSRRSCRAIVSQKNKVGSIASREGREKAG